MAPSGGKGSAATERPPPNELEDASDSLEALIHRFVRALETRDRAELERTLVTFREYRVLLWPEFPVAKRDGERQLPVHWQLLSAQSKKAVDRILIEWGGRPLDIVGIEAGEVREYDTYRAHRGVVVRLSDGKEERRFGDLGSIIERRGRFKLLNVKD